MKSKLFISLQALGCLALASCYVLPDGPGGPRGPSQEPEKKTVTSKDQQKIKEQRERLKEREKEKEETSDTPKEKPKDETTAEKPAEPKRTDYAFANPVPGKEGFVFSPYNNKLVDVRDIPSGTLVQDPTYPAAEKKYFRVP